MQNDIGYGNTGAGGAMQEGAPRRGNALMKPRRYFLSMAALVVSGFLLVTIGSMFFADPAVLERFPQFNSVTTIVITLAALIIGLVLQWRGQKVESVWLCLAGFYLISAVLGALTSIMLLAYDLQSITSAFLGTIVIAVSFGALGFAFPSFFQKIHGILVVCLIGLIVAEIVLVLLGVNQGVTDWLVLAVFCGFIGYDFYQAAQAPPTPINAVIFATEIYLDLLNVFVRLLAIFGNRD